MKTKQIVKAISIVGILALTTIQVKAQSAAGSANVVKGVGSIPTVKVVDNKGTVKYFQSNNGITQITSTTAGSATTTTWQLGGTLTDNTFINATGKVFALDGLAISALAASTDATTGAIHGTGTGYTLLVRNEESGAIEKILASDLISAGVGISTATADVAAAATYTTIAFPGLTTVDSRVSVYRNGVKLLQTDWAFNGTDVTKIDIPSTVDLPIYTDDVIEVQWVK